MTRILCVDDVADNLKLLTAELEDVGYEVITASNGREALERVAADAPDAIILDVMMPVMDGLSTLRELRKRHDALSLPVLMATALSESEDVTRAFALGANDYVVKPLEMDVVLARLRTHLELARLKRAADDLSKLRDDFVAIASHDLKNPLGNILGFAGLAQQLMPLGEPVTAQGLEFIDRIHVNASNMLRLISDFLDFQAIEDGAIRIDAKRVDTAALVRDVVRGHRERAASKKITLEHELTPTVPHIVADPARVVQVVDNLVSNAVKFCRPGDVVVVTARVTGARVRIEVRDSGPGLLLEDLPRVFGKFARLSNKPTGGEKSTGLGLRICKQLVEAHGGSVGVHNNAPAPGATFWFELDVAP